MRKQKNTITEENYVVINKTFMNNMFKIVCGLITIITYLLYKFLQIYNPLTKFIELYINS